MNKKFAFTLSEVLVTMGIIGVISALTVPTLVNNYQRKAQALQFRKTVTDIGNAVDMLITAIDALIFLLIFIFTSLWGVGLFQMF